MVDEFENLMTAIRGITHAQGEKARSFVERRASRRLIPGALECNLGRVIDLSADGAKVSTRRRLKGEQTVELRDDRQQLTVPARVVWTKRVGWLKHVSGLQFRDVTPDLAYDLVAIALGDQISRP